MYTSTRATQLAWQRQCDDIGTSIDCRLLARQGEGERMRSSELQGRESYPQHHFDHVWRVSVAILGVPGGGGERDGALKNVAAAIGGGRTSGPRATSAATRGRQRSTAASGSVPCEHSCWTSGTEQLEGGAGIGPSSAGAIGVAALPVDAIVVRGS